jgi:hypothetical protein
MSFLSGLTEAFLSGFVSGAGAEVRHEVATATSTEARTEAVAHQSMDRAAVGARFAEPLHVERVHRPPERADKTESDKDIYDREMHQYYEDVKREYPDQDNKADTDK